MAGKMPNITISNVKVVGVEPEEQEKNMKRLVDELLVGFREVKDAFDVTGMNYGYLCEVTDTGSANEEFVVKHSFSVVPDGYLVAYQNKAGSVYDGDTAWDGTNIYLKASTANMHVKVLVFTSTN